MVVQVNFAYTLKYHSFVYVLAGTKIYNIKYKCVTSTVSNHQLYLHYNIYTLNRWTRDVLSVTQLYIFTLNRWIRDVLAVPVYLHYTILPWVDV